MFFALNLRVPPSFTCIWHGTPCIWPPKLPRTETPMLRYNASLTHHTSSAAHSARMLSAQLDVLNPPILPKSDCITWAIVAPLYGGIIHYFLCAVIRVGPYGCMHHPCSKRIKVKTQTVGKGHSCFSHLIGAFPIDIMKHHMYHTIDWHMPQMTCEFH